MNESELLRELSRKTGLPESAAEAVLRGCRELVVEGAVDPETLLATKAATVVADAAGTVPVTDARLHITSPEDPSLVDEVIARARKHPLGLEFLVSGFLASVAIALGAHAFTIEAARARLRKEKTEETKETTAP